MGRVFKPQRKKSDGSVWVSPKWYLEFRDASGAQKRIPASESKSEAKGLLKELESRERRRALGIDAMPAISEAKTLPELVEEYLREARQRLRPRTVETYADALRLTLLGQDRNGNQVGRALTLEAVSMSWATRYQQESASTKSPRTINKNLRTVSQLMNWAVRMGQLQENPIRHLAALPQKPLVEPKALSMEEEAALLKAAGMTPRNATRPYASPTAQFRAEWTAHAPTTTHP